MRACIIFSKAKMREQRYVPLINPLYDPHVHHHHSLMHHSLLLIIVSLWSICNAQKGPRILARNVMGMRTAAIEMIPLMPV
jgi:hypothetical protein